MSQCLYGPHRLIVTAEGYCERCGEDFRLQAKLQRLPVLFYNNARALWDKEDYAAASIWLEAAIAVRDDFPEAHWLLGMTHARLGNADPARRHLGAAVALGAAIDAAEMETLLRALRPGTAGGGDSERAAGEC